MCPSTEKVKDDGHGRQGAGPASDPDTFPGQLLGNRERLEMCRFFFFKDNSWGTGIVVQWVTPPFGKSLPGIQVPGIEMLHV